MAKLSKATKKSTKNSITTAAAKNKKVVDLKDDEENQSTSDNEEPKEVSNENNSNLLNECKRLFDTTDLYKVLDLEKTATANDIKKAYYKFSLRFHPDKVTGDDEAKKEGTVKFQVLGKVYTVLGDEDKRNIYDESGAIDGEDDASIFNSNIKDWEQYWRSLFKKISKEDIDNFFATYKNSDEERKDLLKFYEKHKGDMDLINQEMFSEDPVEDEPRFKQILFDAIEQGDIKKYDKFVNESKKKANKRKANQEKEAKEAEMMRKELGIDEIASEDSLRMAILSRRQAETDNFLDQLTKKYGSDKSGNKKSKTATTSNSGRKGNKISDELSNQENVSDDEDEGDEETGVKSSGRKKSAAVAVASSAGKGRKVKRL